MVARLLISLIKYDANRCTKTNIYESYPNSTLIDLQANI